MNAPVSTDPPQQYICTGTLLDFDTHILAGWKMHIALPTQGENMSSDLPTVKYSGLAH